MDNPIEGNDAGILVHYQGNLISVSGQSRQIFYPGIQHNSHLERIFAGGWKPWEWVNPPMDIGVEYRTTERYFGKPVYIKAVYISALPNNAQKAVGLGVTQEIFRPISFGGNAVSSDGSLSYALPSSGNNIAVNDINLQIFGGSAYIKTNSDYSAYSAIVWVKYYKTTD